MKLSERQRRRAVARRISKLEHKQDALKDVIYYLADQIDRDRYEHVRRDLWPELELKPWEDV